MSPKSFRNPLRSQIKCTWSRFEKLAPEEVWPRKAEGCALHLQHLLLMTSQTGSKRQNGTMSASRKNCARSCARETGNWQIDPTSKTALLGRAFSEQQRGDGPGEDIEIQPEALL